MPLSNPSSGGEGATNKGKAWIAHGNNVVTFAAAHADTNYRWVVHLAQAAISGITPRNVPHTRGMSLAVANETTTRGKVRLDGGYGFTTCGYQGSSLVGTTQRYDNIANGHTTRANATARQNPAGFSLGGYGFALTGYNGSYLNTNERFDDVANGYTARANALWNTTEQSGYSLGGYGFVLKGWVGSVQYRFDDAINGWASRTPGYSCGHPAGYSTTSYGFSSGGTSNGSNYIATTERFDDVANGHTGRANLNAARRSLSGYLLDGYGFALCGYNGSYSGTNERFDDIANAHGYRAGHNVREQPWGFALNGFGFMACGWNSSSGQLWYVDRYDDVTNNLLNAASATTRTRIAGYATNEYWVNYATFEA